MTAELYGRGLAFPVRTDTSGRLAEAAGAAKIEDSIRIILGTQYGERVMRPRFGCNLRSLAFAPNNTATAQLARYYVEEGLRRWEPRIDLLDVLVQNDNRGGALVIHIHYRLKGAEDLRTFPYRFPLEQA
jgi:uncharacterized protein